MDFAADAVFDVVAPPARPNGARPAPALDASEPTFDDHLEAATSDDESAKPPIEAKSDDEPQPVSADEAPVELHASSSLAEPPAPQHIVQIVATPAPPPTPTPNDVEPESSAASATPIEAASAPQAPPPVAQPVDAQATPGAADVAPAQAKSEAPAKSASPDTAPEGDAAPQAPTISTAQAATAATTPTPTQPPAPAPTTEAVPAELANVAAQQPALVDRQTLAPQRPVKSEPQRGAKQVDATSGERADAQPVSTPQTQKSAPATNAAKDAASSLLALQADAPEIPAPASQHGATPFAQPAAQAQQTAAADHAAISRATPAAAQVAHEIVRRFNGDNTRFELRLDPPELGRVEVRLEVSRDHRVTAVIAADSPQALTELARHARELESMLNSAGLELSDSGLSFDLRQGGEGAADADDANGSSRAESNDDTQQQASIAARPLGFERWRGVRVDVTV